MSSRSKKYIKFIFFSVFFFSFTSFYHFMVEFFKKSLSSKRTDVKLNRAEPVKTFECEERQKHFYYYFFLLFKNIKLSFIFFWFKIVFVLFYIFVSLWHCFFFVLWNFYCFICHFFVCVWSIYTYMFVREKLRPRFEWKNYFKSLCSFCKF